MEKNTSINLLPSELRVNYPIVRVSVKFKKMIYIEVIALVFALVVVVSLGLIFQTRLNSATSTETELKQSISALEDTEQQFYLVKDRAQKISKVLSDQDAFPDVKTLENFTDNLPAGVSFVGLNVDPTDENGISMNFVVDSSNSAGNLMTQLQLLDYSGITLQSFSTTNEGGYFFNVYIKK